MEVQGEFANAGFIREYAAPGLRCFAHGAGELRKHAARRPVLNT